MEIIPVMSLLRSFTSIVLISIPTFILPSCDRDDGFEDDIDKHLQWQRIDFPGEFAINSVYGSLEDVMLVSTLFHILRTDDGGHTWEVVKETTDVVARFYKLDDALFAITNFKDFVSYDNGLTWEPVDHDLELTQSQLAFTDANEKILYQIVPHSHGELALPTTLLRSVDSGTSWKSAFPHKHVFSAWHIDNGSTVYLGTSGHLWDGNFFVEDPQSHAYLYYSAK
jgi:photosystem II stability/assembly factor-like uncharacterized protein